MIFVEAVEALKSTYHKSSIAGATLLPAVNGIVAAFYV